jgi:hypothetical protein
VDDIAEDERDWCELSTTEYDIADTADPAIETDLETDAEFEFAAAEMDDVVAIGKVDICGGGAGAGGDGGVNGADGVMDVKEGLTILMLLLMAIVLVVLIRKGDDTDGRALELEFDGTTE